VFARNGGSEDFYRSVANLS
jgi:hypothetical protein